MQTLEQSLIETCRQPSIMHVMNFDQGFQPTFQDLCIVFSLIDGTDVKIVYRHYATLYFVFCVDSSESELGILDLIQVNILMFL